MSISGGRDPSPAKGPEAFRTISEVAEELDLPQHVLRFWETRFTQIKPMKRGGGRRYYRPDDVDLLRGIRLLLYGEGFTIRGVQRLLKEKGVAFVVAAGQSGSVQTVTAADMDAGDEPEELAAAEPETPARREPSGPDRPDAAQRQFSGPAAGPVATMGGLAKEARARLRAALAELEEAKRLLDQSR